MNEFFHSKEEFLKEFREMLTEYKTDKNYNKNLDINYTLRLKKQEILEGITKTIKINKKKVSIKVPTNIQNGQVMILQHEGERIGKKYGNLNLKINID